MNTEQNIEFLTQKATIIFATTVVATFLGQTFPLVIIPLMLVYVWAGRDLIVSRQRQFGSDMGQDAMVSSSLTMLFITAAILVADKTQGVFTLPLALGFAVAGGFLLLMVAVPNWICYLQVQE